MPLLEATQNSPEWLAARKGKITASIAAACLGEDPHKSRQAAWRTILGTEKEYKENRHQRWGHEHEDDARAAYEIISGNIVHTTGFWIHPVYDWLGASPDGIVYPTFPLERRIVEVKCYKLLPEAIPRHNSIQMSIQMACTESAFGDYFVYHSIDKYFFASQLSRETAELIERLDEFRHKYVLPGIEPERKTRAKKAVLLPNPAIIMPEELEQTMRNLETYPP